MADYLIKMLPTDECNSEFTPDKNLQEGIEADGVFMMCFEKGDLSFSVLHGITTFQLAKALANDKDPVNSCLHQAVAIADGLRNAMEIKKDFDRNKTAKGIADMFRNID